MPWTHTKVNGSGCQLCFLKIIAVFSSYMLTQPWFFKTGLGQLKYLLPSLLLEISEGKFQFRLIYVTMLNASKSLLDLTPVAYKFCPHYASVN